MDPEILAFFTLLLGIAVGAAIGWFLGNRSVNEWRQRFDARDLDVRELDDKFRRAIRDLEGASVRAAQADDLARRADEASLRLEQVRTEHAAQLDMVRAARDQVLNEKAVLAAELAARKADADNFEKQLQLLKQAQESLRKEFENAGSKVLEKAQESFLARAQERFGQSEEKNVERIRSLLAPVGERLQSYERQVETLEKQRIDAFSQLFTQITLLREGQEKVRDEAMRLGNSLRNAPKARGRWGEQQLRNVLEQCGLSEHTDFVTEQSINTDEGRLRPDAIVRVPGNKQLVIDAKVSLNAYQDAFDADTDDGRKRFLDQHAASMRNHIQALGTKNYQSQFENAPDYVIMFVPGEHFIAAALEHDSSIWDFAFRNKVLLASPTNLVAIARTIAQVWQQEGLAKEAREIGKLASDLYDSLAKTQDDLAKTGIHLGRAVNSFNDFARTYDGNVLSRARRLTEKHVKMGKREISEEVPLVESAPRHAEATDELVALPVPETE